MTFSIETDKYDLFEIVNGKKEVIAKNCNIFELYEAINQEKHGYSYTTSTGFAELLVQR